MKTVKKVNAFRARKQLGQLLEEVYHRGDQFVIERAGKPMAAVVPVWQLEEWRERRVRFFGRIDSVWRGNRRVRSKAIEGQVQEAVRASRSGRSRRKA